MIEFVAEAEFVGAFEQAGTETRMRPHRQADDLMGEAAAVGIFHALALQLTAGVQHGEVWFIGG
jgi:hypothetical protein